MSVLSKPYFHDEAAAFEKVEALLWPHGPVCPHCGGAERVYDLQKTRIGLRKCGHCRKQFTIRVGTVFESSHVPLHKWLQAIFLMASSKKGISANQLHRTLEVTVKTAGFMAHRIREAMRSGDLSPMGGDGGTVEVDETFIGHDQTKKPKGDKCGRGYAHKYKVLTLVERGGTTRSMVVNDLKAKTLVPKLKEQIDHESRVITDEAGQYVYLSRNFATNEFVRHSKSEYARGDVHTNTIEGYFRIFKRGMKGVYQHCAEKHLPRYLAEFDFRYDNRSASGVEDHERADRAICGAAGKHLYYHQPA